jgi:hypothetical protein
MLLRHYDRDASPRSTPPLEDLEKLFRLSRMPAYAAEIAQAQAGEDAGHAEFRSLLAQNRVSYLDRFLAAERASAAQPSHRSDTRT